MLIPLLIGGIQIVKSEVIIPAGTRLEFENLTGVTTNSDFATFSQDFNCSISNKFHNTNGYYNGPVWAFIEALSDSVGSFLGASTSTDKVKTFNLNSLG